MRIDDRTEWLEADGLGGFASGTTSGIRTRRYHAFLSRRRHHPRDGNVLVNGVELGGYEGRLVPPHQSTICPGVLHPNGATQITSFVAIRGQRGSMTSPTVRAFDMRWWSSPQADLLS